MFKCLSVCADTSIDMDLPSSLVWIVSVVLSLNVCTDTDIGLHIYLHRWLFYVLATCTLVSVHSGGEVLCTDTNIYISTSVTVDERRVLMTHSA